MAEQNSTEANVSTIKRSPSDALGDALSHLDRATAVMAGAHALAISDGTAELDDTLSLLELAIPLVDRCRDEVDAMDVGTPLLLYRGAACPNDELRRALALLRALHRESSSLAGRGVAGAEHLISLAPMAEDEITAALEFIEEACAAALRTETPPQAAA